MGEKQRFVIRETTAMWPAIYAARVWWQAKHTTVEPNLSDYRYSVGFPVSDMPQDMRDVPGIHRLVKTDKETGLRVINAKSDRPPVIIPKGGTDNIPRLAGVLFDASECRIRADRLLINTKVGLVIDTFIGDSMQFGRHTQVVLIGIEVDYVEMAKSLKTILDDLMGVDDE